MLLLYLAFLFVWIYAIVDAITAEESLVRNLPKVAWVFIIFIGNIFGAVAWLLLGRPQTVSATHGYRPRHPPAPGKRTEPPRGPEDSPGFMRRFEQPDADGDGADT